MDFNTHMLTRSKLKKRGSSILFQLENEYPNRDDTLGALADVPTIIDVQLLDLRTQPVLEHTIDLDILNTWSAPDQINL